MDLSYFDELIKETDSFLKGLDKDTIRLLNDNIYRYQRFKKNFKLDKRSFYDYQSSLKYYDTLAKKTKSERKDVFESIIRNAKNELFYTRNNYWHERWREENRENLVEVLDFLENFYEQFSEGLKSFKGQLYENKKYMDLSYFDKLIEEADRFMYNLTDDNDRGIIHNLIVNYEGFKKRIKLKKRSFSDYDTSLKYFDTLGKKSKDELKATFEPIVNRAKNQLDNIKTNYWHISARESGEELRKLGHDKQVLRVLDFLENFYEQFSKGLESFKGQLYENKNKTQKMKIVKHTTVGNLKRKINESRERTALGLGFGSKPAYESNVDQMMSAYQRKIGNKGATGLGQGFKQMDEVQMVEFISNMVESLKGKTEYHNLKFVDRLGSEYSLNERQVRTIKSIIKEGSRRAPKKLRRYINENVALGAQEMYEGYYGLTNEAEAMIPEIKKMFNENKRACGNSEKAAQMTAEALDIPQEMVKEMYGKMKESYEMKMEGGSMDVEGALHEIYGKYQNMSEGNMEPMYDEISELMMYEEDMPEPEDFSFEEEEDYMPSEEEREYSRKSLSGEEDSYNPFEEFFADNPEEIGIDEEYLYEDDEMCMECGKSGMYESVKRKLNILKKKNRNRF